MWEGSYGREPFDLRLTVLRLMRNLDKLLALTLVGTLVFGGGYYVKNVLMRPEIEYAATSTYKLQYVDEPTKAGDYYINEATWNDLVDTQEFIAAVQEHLAMIPAEERSGIEEISNEELVVAISAKLPSNWNIPTTTVTTTNPAKTLMIAKAVEQAFVKEFPERVLQEVAAVQVIDAGDAAEEVPLDVRPARAFVLSAVLSFFFITVVFLLKETGDDSIWLPATIRKRYGLPVLGTVNSVDFVQNVKYLFAGKQKVAVCSVDGAVSTADVLAEVKKHLEQKSGTEAEYLDTTEWTAVPTPLLCPEVCDTLREMEGVLLVVQAGSHAGKPLEYVMEMLKQQDCNITGVIMWEADELLLRAYYCFGDATATKEV